MLVAGLLLAVFGVGFMIYALIPQHVSAAEKKVQFQRSETQTKKEQKKMGLGNLKKGHKLTLKERLFRAGIVSDAELKKFYFIQAVSPVIGFLVGFLIPAYWGAGTLGTIVGVLGALLGAVYPSFYLRKRQKKQQEEISYYLPITIEQIAIGVSSGLDIGPCIQFLLDLAEERKSHNAVTQFLKLAVHMSRQGVPFDEALLEIGKASGDSDLKHCFLALGQVYKHGGEVSKQLMEIAAAVNAQRQIKIDEKIKKIPLKAVLVVGVILFAFILMILVGVGLSLFKQMKSFNQDVSNIKQEF